MLDRRQFLGTGAISLGGLTAGVHRSGGRWSRRSRALRAAPPAPRAVRQPADRRSAGAHLPLFLGHDRSGHRAHARSLADAVLRVDRRGRLRADRLSDRRRQRLDHARTGARADARHAASSSRPRRRARADRQQRATRASSTTSSTSPRASGSRARNCRRSIPRCCSAGMLFAQSWFDRAITAEEQRIRDARRPDLCARSTGPGSRRARRSCRWAGIPRAASSRSDWNIYNEGMLIYLLALGSPTHPLPPSTWDAWRATLRRQLDRSWRERSSRTSRRMFGHQYSHVWIDFRGIRDALHRDARASIISRTAAARRCAQRDYAIANPAGWHGYGADIWGLTACDGPGDFKRDDRRARRASSSAIRRAARATRDDGTIAPTAAVGSIAFAPEIVHPRDHARCTSATARGIYGKYGFLDSFNPTLTEIGEPLKHGRIVPGIGWVDDDYLGIDQGPIVAMIENWRTGWSGTRCGATRISAAGWTVPALPGDGWRGYP